jgi:hypothetical protein
MSIGCTPTRARQGRVGSANYVTKYLLIGWAAIVAAIWMAAASATELTGLPVQGRAQWPLILLELGSEPPSVAANGATTEVYTGEITAHEGDESVRTDRDEVVQVHKGFGRWSAVFRFPLERRPRVDAPYAFWAQWRQGGNPKVCLQTFEVWAGPDATGLARRAAFRLKPAGWQYAWAAGNTPLRLKPDDAVIEVRASGAAHNAKVFDAFLLAPAASTPRLPIGGTADKPVILLKLGKASQWASVKENPAVRVYPGTATAQEGADSVVTANEELQVLRKGYGTWGATFEFKLSPAIPPGLYSFYARYRSGGEVSQVVQTFTVKAGPEAQSSGTRGSFSLRNTTPWRYQWLRGESTVAMLPGDAVVRIENVGKADGAKIFDSFLLKLESPLGDWMTAGQAQLRNGFFALIQKVQSPDRRLYVLDGKGEGAEALFHGLASEAALPWYNKTEATYLVGPEAEAMARRLNLNGLPAAVITDANYGLLSALANPKSAAAAARFLADPGKAGTVPNVAQAEVAAATPLHNGVPEGWLVGGLQDGVGGMSIFGLDTETILRPNADQPYLSTEMMGGSLRSWQRSPTAQSGVTVIEAATSHSYGWSRGTGYAQLYLHTETPIQTVLRLRQSGIKTAGWLDGRPLAFSNDSAPPDDFPKPGEQPKMPLQGLTTEGLVMTAMPERGEPPQAALLNLSPGWHSLLLKLVMQHDKGQSFAFAARFTDATGLPVAGIKTQLTDPAADLALNAPAARLRPLVYVDALANLPRPGDRLEVRADVRWHPIRQERTLAVPLASFRARLRLRLTDYDSKEIAVREVEGQFPGEVKVDLGRAPETGYYAIYPSLHTAEGNLIMAYPADGFTVVRGAAAQRERLDKKKLWNNDYYALADGDKGFQQEGGYFAWLERMGIYKSYGAYPGLKSELQPKWDEAKRRGIVLFADTSGDSPWLNDKPTDGRKFIETVAPYTRFFKATNEIDIRRQGEWQKLRNPLHWVERAEWEYKAVHKTRPDGHYAGGSLVRPGDMGRNQDYADGLGPGMWFAKVLGLGLDKYQDAWDVHAYPQHPPRFAGPIGNSANEDERGVLAAYARLGRKNTLPFWLGEAGAKAAHGHTGRRWQAEQTAKMIAWVNSRSDYLGLAFCIGHEYDWGYGRLWDYSMGHKPGEAGLYTASALIDGLPYRRVQTGSGELQAAYFGDTFMIWSTGKATQWQMQLQAAVEWVMIDVVGRVKALPLDANGSANISVTPSPVYVVSKDNYQHLTRF